jgi:hypothetical protein
VKSAPAESAPGLPPRGDGLAFDWKRERRFSFRLTMLVFISVVAHAFCFYLFQVVYPASERFIPATAGMTLLSPSDPRSRELLREIEDRVVYFDSSTRESVRELEIDSYAVPFRSSFANHELEIKLAPRVREDAPFPEPFDFERPFLPGVAKSLQEEGAERLLRGAGAAAALQIIPDELLRDRAILARGDWKWASERRAELEGQRVVLTVGVAPQGQLQHVLINTGIDSVLDAKIVAAARGIRFEPGEGSELQWGTLRLQW